jgi:hypothetical protein
METIERNLYEYDGYCPIGLKSAIADYESGKDVGEINNKVDFIARMHIEKKFRHLINAYRYETDYFPQYTHVDQIYNNINNRKFRFEPK